MNRILKLKSALFVFFIIMFCFISCSKANTNSSCIYYEGKYYKSEISDDFTYNSFWYPLNEADISDKALFCNINDDVNKLGKGNEAEIKKFSDKNLNMFIVHKDFWGEWLYCRTDYCFPDINADNIEYLTVKTDSNSKWADYGKQDCFIEINDNETIKSFISDIDKIDYKSSKEPESIPSGYEIGIKFKSINAIYYLGLVSNIDEPDCYFYNAHIVKNNNELINNPFSQ